MPRLLVTVKLAANENHVEDPTKDVLPTRGGFMDDDIYSFIETKVKEVYQIEIDKVKSESAGLQPALVLPYDNNLSALELKNKQLQTRL